MEANRVRAKALSPRPQPRSCRKPGLFAPKGEKELYKAVKSQDVQAMKRLGEQHPGFRIRSYSLAGLMMLTTEPAEAERLLDEVFATGSDPGADKFISVAPRRRTLVGAA